MTLVLTIAILLPLVPAILLVIQAVLINRRGAAEGPPAPPAYPESP